MATTNIHPIHCTLKKAIDYICDPKKTNNQKDISTINCNIGTAEKMFTYTRKKHFSDVNILAFHIVQSFKVGEVTTEQAQAIGKELMNRLLGDKYEVIIATHSDTKCIHNHFIVNSVNMINGKAFSTEHDRKSYPAWRKIRNINDKLMIENGLDVVNSPENKGKSYYEWAMSKQGKSWKEQLKAIIDDTIRKSDNFSDYLTKMRNQNVIVRYEPYKTKEGMILAYKQQGQKNFIYSKKLGKFYSERAIKERIERCVKRRDMTSTERRQERILNDDGKLKKLYDVESYNEKGLREWAKNENRKIKMQTLVTLHKKGFSSAYELNLYCEDLKKTIDDNSNKYTDVKSKLIELQTVLKYVEMYRDNEEIYDYYKNKTLYPDRYFRSHETEILLFEESKEELKKYGDNIPNRAQLKNKISEMESYLTELRQSNRELRDELYSLDTLQYNLGIIYDDEPVIEPEREPNEQQSTERKKRRSDDFDMEL